MNDDDDEGGVVSIARVRPDRSLVAVAVAARWPVGRPMGICSTAVIDDNVFGDPGVGYRCLMIATKF